MLNTKCFRCGCTGIHACMGTPSTPMTKKQLDELDKAILSIIQTEEERKFKLELTLTKEQIKNLAVYAGFHVQDISGSASSTEYNIGTGTIKGDTNSPEYTGLIVYTKDYPEDGANPLA